MLPLLLACAPDPPRDVLLVTLDTARADRFGYLGAAPTPGVDGLAAEGLAFTQAVSPAPITLVAHATLMTGLAPPRHGVRNNGTYALDGGVETLAERLRASGRSTGAFVAAAVLDRRYGLDQGFDTYDDAVPAGGMYTYARRPGGDVVAAALAWLDAHPEPTFAWVHLFDAHAPYAGGGYDAAITTIDGHVATLLDGYRARDRYDDALIVLTADHGESLGEHGEQTHGVFVYDATTRVPLVMRSPGLAPRREDAQVGLADLMPTVLSLCGLAPQDADGIALTGPIPARTLALESLLPFQNYGWAPVRGLRTATRKGILAVGAESYDLAADPGEAADLGEAGAPDLVAELRAQPVAPLLAPPPGVADDATRKQLAALGYVELDHDGGDPAALPDPRARIGEGERMAEAAAAMARGDSVTALATMRALTSEDPGNGLAWARLGAMAWQAGDSAEAARAWGEAATRSPEDVTLRENQGAALERAGDVDGALAAYAAAGARSRAWALRARAGQLDALRRELDAQPADAELAVFLAESALSSGDPSAAEPLLRLALAASPAHPRASLHLARLLLLRGDVVAAAPLAEAADPATLPALLLVRAEARGRASDWDGAWATAERARIELPDRADTWTLSGWIRLNRGDPAGARADLERAASMGGVHPLQASALEEARRRAP